MGAEKSKVRLPFKIAFAVVAGFFGLQLASEGVFSRLADETPAALKQTGLQQSDVKAMAEGAAVSIMRPASNAALAFAYATLDPREVAIKKNVHEESKYSHTFTAYGAEAHRDPLFGPGRPVDRLTFGLTGNLIPCAVSFPGGEIDPRLIAAELSRLPPADFRHLPAGAKDFGKILLLHELAHCGIPGMYSGDVEAGADEKAVAHYLATGGDRDVALAFVQVRALGSLMDSLEGNDFGGPSSDDHISALIMHERFFGGPPVTYNESRRAFRTAASAIRAYNSSLPLPERGANGVNDSRFFGRIEAMLGDTNVSLEPAARHALRLCVDGFRSFSPPLTQGLSVPFSLKN